MTKLFNKSAIALCMAVLMLLSFAVGCSSKDEAQAVGGSGGTGEKVCKVGIIGPFTGPASRTGEEFKNAIDMAFSAVDYKIGDYKLEVIWIDSESDAEKAARAYEQAIVKDKIDVGFLTWHSWVSLSCMEVAAKYKMPHFFSFGAGEDINQKIKNDYDKYKYWVGKAWPTSSLLTSAYVETIEQAIADGTWTPRNKKMSIYGVDNDWGRNFGNAIAQQFKDAGWDVISEEWITIGETDFYPLITKLKKQDVSMIAGTMSDPSAVTSFIKQTREVGLNSLIISDGLGWVGEWYGLAGDASDYVLDQIPQWTTDKAKAFNTDFTAKYGFEPGPSAGGMCYDWANFFLKVCEKTLQEYGDLSTDSFRKVADEWVIPGKISYTDGIIHKEYKYTPETFPDMVVDQDHYIFPVVQYFGGEGKMIWPDAWADQKITIPDFAK